MGSKRRLALGGGKVIILYRLCYKRLRPRDALSLLFGNRVDIEELAIPT